eukprot:891173-Rhodomonas_salina.1
MSGQATWETVLGEEDGSSEQEKGWSPDVTNISSDSEPSPVIVGAAEAPSGGSRSDGKSRLDEALPPPPPK